MILPILKNLMGVKSKLTEKNLMTLIFIILVMNIKKITQCNVINSVNPLYLRIRDKKGQLKKR